MSKRVFQLRDINNKKFGDITVNTQIGSRMVVRTNEGSAVTSIPTDSPDLYVMFPGIAEDITISGGSGGTPDLFQSISCVYDPPSTFFTAIVQAKPGVTRGLFTLLDMKPPDNIALNLVDIGNNQWSNNFKDGFPGPWACTVILWQGSAYQVTDTTIQIPSP